MKQLKPQGEVEEMGIKWYGIKTPETEYDDSYIYWITTSEHESWDSFFQYPDRNGNFLSHRAPLEEAKRAYEAIGYKCVELEVKEKEDMNEEKKDKPIRLDDPDFDIIAPDVEYV